jgi:hypothetical protein
MPSKSDLLRAYWRANPTATTDAARALFPDASPQLIRNTRRAVQLDTDCTPEPTSTERVAALLRAYPEMRTKDIAFELDLNPKYVSDLRGKLVKRNLAESERTQMNRRATERRAAVRDLLRQGFSTKAIIQAHPDSYPNEIAWERQKLRDAQHGTVSPSDPTRLTLHDALERSPAYVTHWQALIRGVESERSKATFRRALLQERYRLCGIMLVSE